jgi:GntR family histidine utilization transcriptional repressor
MGANLASSQMRSNLTVTARSPKAMARNLLAYAGATLICLYKMVRPACEISLSPAATPVIDAEPSEAGLGERIRRDLERRIVSGEWPPGHRIPTEHDLMRAYGCSRMTMNKALTSLAANGLIERRRRAGTFVTQPSSQSALLEIPDIEAEVAALGLGYRLEIVSRDRRRSNRTDMARLGVTTAREILELVCRHRAGPRVWAVENRLIDLTRVPEARHASFTTEPPGTWLTRRVPWSEAEHRISAISADAEQASTLSVPLGTACLQIERTTWCRGQPVTAVRLLYPGHSYRLIARFSPVGAESQKSAPAARSTRPRHRQPAPTS